MNTPREIRKKAILQLEGAGSETSRLDVDLLLEEALDQSAMDILLEPDQKVTKKEMEAFQELLARRIAREPVSQILGKKNFWSLTFRVSSDCLTPRPDSETLIEAALKDIRDRNTALKILDLGTGSGCLLLSLMSELPNSTGVGIDISDKALAVAEYNALKLGFSERCEFILSDWTEQLPLPREFDIILCNPPYISHEERADLAPEVRDYEPHKALFAEDNGYSEYIRLAEVMPKLVKARTSIFLEIGHTQGNRTAEIFKKTGARNIRIIQDLAGRDRCVALKY